MKIKILILWLVILSSGKSFAQFITEWNTGASSTITVPTTGAGYNYTATIALQDTPAIIITTLTGVTGNAIFTGLMPNTAYQVKITGSFTRIYFNNTGDKLKLRNISQWGNIAWTNFSRAFFGCTQLTITATDAPILSGVTDMSQMFMYCSALDGPANIGNWDTTSVTNMNNMFNWASAFNQNIGNWNTSSVTNMASMFSKATAFNQNIGNWNTGAVTDMNYMFFEAAAFNQPIGSWNTGLVTNMDGMFQKADVFNQNLDGWNTASVINMRSMFNGATAFNQSISGWDTGAVTDMSNMFNGAVVFNQNIANWDTSSVIDMTQMFAGAATFNQDIGSWDTAAVERTNAMFRQASAFNKDIGDWDMSSVWNMLNMFLQATSFNQDLSDWDVSSATSMEAMFKDATAFDQNLAGWADNLNPNAVLGSFFGGIFDNCGMSVANYDATLQGFNDFGPNGITMGALGMYYCNDGAEARANLILPVANGGKGWIITGDTDLSTSIPILAVNGTTVSLTETDCNNGWASAANRARKMLVINENGNTVSPANVTINHNNIGVLPNGVTSQNGYYQISNGTGSTRLGNRLVSIEDENSYDQNDGVITRVYYSAQEYTNIVVTPPAVGEIVDAGWFISGNTTAAEVIAGMNAGTYALPQAEKIIPFNSGMENGYAFVEFKITKPGTIGLYAKTTQGPLSDPLSVEDFGKTNTIVIYPNPVSSILNIQLPVDIDLKTAEISIINMLGQKVYSNSTKIEAGIDVGFLMQGLYHIIVSTPQGEWMGKFIKE
jgi:surface protein